MEDIALATREMNRLAEMLVKTTKKRRTTEVDPLVFRILARMIAQAVQAKVYGDEIGNGVAWPHKVRYYEKAYSFAKTLESTSKKMSGEDWVVWNSLRDHRDERTWRSAETRASEARDFASKATVSVLAGSFDKTVTELRFAVLDAAVILYHYGYQKTSDEMDAVVVGIS